METQLRHDMRGPGHTFLRGRAKFTSENDVVFRMYTTVNTSASTVLFDGYLHKMFGVTGDKHGFEDSRLRIGGGFRVRAGTDLNVRNLFSSCSVLQWRAMICIVNREFVYKSSDVHPNVSVLWQPSLRAQAQAVTALANTSASVSTKRPACHCGAVAP